MAYEYVDPAQRSLECAICLEVAEEPMVHDREGCEGLLFCKACVDKHGKETCPVCKREDPKYMEDDRSKLKIMVHVCQPSIDNFRKTVF